MTNEELEQEVKRLEEQITNLRIKILESKANKKPYEVEVPEDIEEYVTLDEYGNWCKMFIYDEDEKNKIFRRGLTFKTIEEAEKYRNERMLLFKLHKWAEEHNEGWTVDFENFYEYRYCVKYDYKDERFYVESYKYGTPFNKLPYLKSYELAQQFIEEFGDEIIEVLC